MQNELSPLVNVHNGNVNDDGSTDKKLRMRSGTTELDVILAIFKGNVGPGGFSKTVKAIEN